MKDKEFMIWIHDRLECVYGENPLTDYMRKLRAIISTIPVTQDTPPSLGQDNTNHLYQGLYRRGTNYHEIR